MRVMPANASEQQASVKCASYLLVLDGSAEALAAAGFAWDLAQSTKARVIAQHVLDPPAVWGSLSYSIPGLVGSGIYIEAQKKITEALRSIAETVMLSYSTQAEGHHLQAESYIDEGDTVTEICRRAMDHDLVIVGQVAKDDIGPEDKSLGARISQHCQKPVIIVQIKDIPRSGLHIIIANETYNSEAVLLVREFARSASIPTD